MAKPNYQFEKRQRELEKKRKKAEKERKKAPYAEASTDTEAAPAQDNPPPPAAE